MSPAGRFRSDRSHRVTAAITLVALLLPMAALPAKAQESAVFAGTVFDPSGAPVQAGFKVVLTDVSTGAQYTATTNASGAYRIPVPVGGRYKLFSVTAPDGTALPLQNSAAISAMYASTNQLDVKFLQKAPPASAATTTPPATPQQSQVAAGEKPGTPPPKKPWYKKPGPIVGIVLGAAAVAAIAIGSGGGGGNGNCNNASPSTPGC